MICDLELWLISDFLAQHVCSESRVSKKMDIRNMWEGILLKGVPHRTIAWITFRGPQPWFGAALPPVKTCFSHIGNYRETVGNHPTGSLRIWRQKNHLLPVFFFLAPLFYSENKVWPWHCIEQYPRYFVWVTAQNPESFRCCFLLFVKFMKHWVPRFWSMCTLTLTIFVVVCSVRYKG